MIQVDYAPATATDLANITVNNPAQRAAICAAADEIDQLLKYWPPPQHMHVRVFKPRRPRQQSARAITRGVLEAHFLFINKAKQLIRVIEYRFLP